MAVSLRARLPALTEVMNIFSNSGPSVSASLATFIAPLTWPRISDSPMTWESSPAATWQRCLAASNPVSW